MCVAFVLLMNSFYKVYYWLFDLCEHVVAMLLLLGALCLIFTPLLFSVHPSEEQRPLFTIVILVTGVVGGLVIVITVVYFYRFCLRKRPPVTTTGKPEQKREQVRSLAQSQCRPLPIPSLIPHADHNPLYQHFMPQSQQTKPALPEKSVLLDLASDTSKIAQVFPLMTRTPGQPSQKLFETQQAQPVQIQVPIQVQVTKPTIEFQKADSETAPRAPMQTSQQTQKAASQHSSTHFLNVEQPTPYRARSAEFLSPSKGIDDDELRRASFDGTGRRPGTGRQLPSTEHLQAVDFVGL
ncbi:hypothetical protein QR680_000854 [Steinernema hermaphroditum]|uniref:Uncharacterized protein n=1 Tax=Steinernema hermaphroditum TaxID=289476 RepID=A0AA39GW42_9BILA|nr:hypothetical protein QR680_000854 [Steinernema hermaphroditum]